MDAWRGEWRSDPTGGTRTLRLGKTTIGEGRIEKQVPLYFTTNETFDVDTILGVMVDISALTFEQLAEHHEAHAKFAMTMS